MYTYGEGGGGRSDEMLRAGMDEKKY